MNNHTRHKEIEHLKPDVLEALASGQTMRSVAKQYGIGLSRVNDWWQATKTLLSVTPADEQRLAERWEQTLAERWEAVQRRAMARMEETLPKARLRDASVAAGIAADKHQDYTVGRKGTQAGDTPVVAVQINITQEAKEAR